MTTSAEALRAHRGLTLFRGGFRPFFLGGAIFAGIALPLWLAAVAWGIAPPSHLPARDWHVHEMIFGYLPAVLAGFLLTAIPNWTGRLPITGPRLAALAGLWLAGRLAIATSALWPWAAVAIDVGFLAALAAVAWREVIAGRNWRNSPVCILITILALGCAGFDIASLTGGATAPFERAALAIAALLIALIGGRIIPSFTRNWMARTERTPLPAAFGLLDRLALGAAAVALVAWIALPMAAVTGALFALAAVLHAIRVARWSAWRTAAEPLVLILHVGYAWIPIWFGLTALSILAPAALDGSTAVHALTAGAVGTMTLAVMSRATLGHSGQNLTADGATSAIYVLVVAGAAGRIVAPYLPVDYVAAVVAAGLLWSAGFALFVVVYGPLLVGERRARN